MRNNKTYVVIITSNTFSWSSKNLQYEEVLISVYRRIKLRPLRYEMMMII